MSPIIGAGGFIASIVTKPGEDIAYAWLGSIVKVEKDGDTRLVYGKVTDGSIDSDEQIVDPAFAKSALADWYDTGANVRQMHATTLPPAGKGISLESITGDGEYVKTKVVEPVAVKLVDEGVYSGYSVGIARPRIVRDRDARNGRITGGKIVEISLVDRPALPTAKFAVLKAAGAGLEYVGKVVTLTPPAPAPKPIRTATPARVKRVRQNMHVTAHLRTAAGSLEAVEGRVVERGIGSFALDTAGYSWDGGIRPIERSDVVALYKGAVPLRKDAKDPAVGGGTDRTKIPKKDFVFPEDAPDGGFPIVTPGDVSDAVSSWGRYKGPHSFADFQASLTRIAHRKGKAYVSALPEAWKEDAAKVETVTKGGLVHTHTHLGPNGVPHRHEHAHAPGTPDHSELHEGGAHAHGHDTTDTEAFVDDTQPVADATKGGTPVADGAPAAVAAPDVAKDLPAPDCEKCGGTGKVAGAVCEKCGGTGKMKTAAKGADLAAAAEDLGEAADDLGQAADDLGNVAGADTDGGNGKDADDGDGNGDKAAKKAAKKAARAEKAATALRVEAVGDVWRVSKGETVLGTHGSEDAARAQYAAIRREQKVARSEKVLARKLARQAKKAARADLTKRAADATPEVPWLIRRAHDYACAAYPTSALALAYPTVEKNGVAEALGGNARTAIYAMLKNELSEDGGSGNEGHDIYELAKAYGALCEFLDTEGADSAPAALLAARDELHTAFKMANGLTEASTDALPKPSETITPGQFRRAYLTAGHQAEVATSHAAGIPTTTHPIEPTSYDRPALTDGHQRYLVSKLEEFHDGLVGWLPAICRMDARGSNAFDRQPVGSFLRPPVGQQMANGATDSPTPVIAAITAKAPGEKITGGAAVGATVTLSSDIAPTVAAPSSADLMLVVGRAVSEAQAPLLRKIDGLQRAYDELAASPDPTRSALRGVTGTAAGREGTVQKVSKVSLATEVQREAVRGKKAERLDFYRSLSRSDDPDQRIRAQDWLASHGHEVA